MKTLSTFVAEALAETFINESVQNLFIADKKQKLQYGEQVWNILQSAYAAIGGIKGSGFKSIDDMINNIPFWKIDVVDNEVLCVLMYKFAETKTKGLKLRKRVAIGKLYDKDRKDLISKKFYNMMKEEFERSIVETSGGSEEFLRKTFGSSTVDRYSIPVDQVKEILFDDEIRAIDKYRYERKINGGWHEKIMVGTLKHIR